ncbi:hypothetical protein SEK29439_19249 [Salmonella enterica subsp. enterica serovar Kentucky str. 29439]|nr:hypothetical protein SEK29439_19249 [Salmonella enterica subsp. enterica serovar Kentucky str. 29439]
MSIDIDIIKARAKNEYRLSKVARRSHDQRPHSRRYFARAFANGGA